MLATNAYIHGDADNDESGYRFGEHGFLPGDYVSIREHDDRLRIFRVATVEDIAFDAA